MLLDIKIAEDLTEYLYNRLPQIYRAEDEKQDKFLYKYLYSLVKGGYNKLINSQYREDTVNLYDKSGRPLTETVNGKQELQTKKVRVLESLGISDFTSLFDPLTCPDVIFKKVYESFGLKYFDKIDIKFQRRFLQNIGYMNRIKGSLVEAKFICSVLTGMDINEARYEKDEYNNRYLIVDLKASSVEDIENVETEANVVSQFLKTRIPFYLEPKISVLIKNKILNTNIHYTERLAMTKGYILRVKD